MARMTKLETVDLANRLYADDAYENTEDRLFALVVDVGDVYMNELAGGFEGHNFAYLTACGLQEHLDMRLDGETDRVPGIES